MNIYVHTTRSLSSCWLLAQAELSPVYTSDLRDLDSAPHKHGNDSPLNSVFTRDAQDEERLVRAYK